MPDLAEEIYRLISKNTGFMKHYGVVRNLVNNPKVPLDITLPMVKRLKGRELRDLKNPCPPHYAPWPRKCLRRAKVHKAFRLRLA